MKMIGKWTFLSILLASIAFSAITYCFGGEPIAPTRMLGEPGKAWGSLAVFSEPPQLEVYLDGEKVGLTPLWLRNVGKGIHTIKIAHAETSVSVEEGGRLKIGLFNGRFVTSLEKERPKIELQQKEPAAVPPPGRSEEEENKGDLRSWEKFVNGSQKFF